MALSAAVLEKALLATLAPPYGATSADAAARWANAYNTYALSAMAGLYPFVPTGLETGKMLAVLTPAFAVSTGTAATMAAAITGGVSAYWAGAFFAPAIAAVPLGALALTTGLTATFSRPSNTAPALALELATLLDACTRTVIATNPATGETYPLA